MAGGISSGASPPKRHIGSEWPQILNLFRSDEQALNRFVAGQPLLNLANTEALGFAGGVGDLIKQITGFNDQLGGFQRGIGGLIPEISGFSRGIGNLIPALSGTLNRTVDPVLRSGGALTSDQRRDVNANTAAIFGSRNMAGGNQAALADVMNLQGAKDARYARALEESQLLTGEISSLEGQRAGLAQEQAGLFGAEAGITGERAGLTGEVQNLETGALNELTGVEGANVGTFTALTNPLLNYASSLFQGNQLSQLQQGIANQNKGAGIVGGIISSLGNIAGSVAMSDKRLKEKIRNTGEKTAHGIPIKTFQWKGDPRKQRFIGVIAQDVAKKAPHAVVRHPSGLIGVSHRALGIPHFPMPIGSASGSERGVNPEVFGEDGRRLDGDATPAWFDRGTPSRPGGPGPAEDNPSWDFPPTMPIDPNIEPTPIPGNITRESGRGPMIQINQPDYSPGDWRFLHDRPDPVAEAMPAISGGYPDFIGHLLGLYPTAPSPFFNVDVGSVVPLEYAPSREIGPDNPVSPIDVQ